jgi:16S rRNA (uracil1498-N3)-methyltransferase
MARRVRVPLPLPPAGEHLIEGAPARYLARVLRLAPGDHFTAFDPAARREAEVTVLELRKHVLLARFEPATEARLLGLPDVTLVQCAGKGDKVDEVVRAATALGASAIVIATSERSVVRGHASTEKLARLTAIALDAARQSGRGDLPELAGPLPLADALPKYAPEHALKLCLSPGAELGLGQALVRRGGRPLVLLVGPEGGFSDGERTLAEQAGFESVRLGTLVLRTELAGSAALGAVLSHG